MILTDHEITALVNEKGLIEKFDPQYLTNIGYDLRTEYFPVDDSKKTSVALKPGESVFIATVENIKMCDDLAGRVVLKNSRIRMGLALDAPVYQPAHHTKIFFRVTNISSDEIILSKGHSYATIIFEKLSSRPERLYDGTFSGEFDFRGLGEYREPYEKQIREIEKKTENLKDMERNIYSNVLVILTVFVALFSFLTTNLSLLSNAANGKQFLVYNFVILGCIAFLVNLMKEFMGQKATEKKKFVGWISTIVPFAVALLIFLAL